jgi:hypothetical protein
MLMVVTGKGRWCIYIVASAADPSKPLIKYKKRKSNPQTARWF